MVVNMAINQAQGHNLQFVPKLNLCNTFEKNVNGKCKMPTFMIHNIQQTPNINALNFKCHKIFIFFAKENVVKNKHIIGPDVELYGNIFVIHSTKNFISFDYQQFK